MLQIGYSNTYAQKHKLEILNPPEEEKDAWHCFECNQSFSSSKILQKHLNEHDDSKDENLIPKKRIFKKKQQKRRVKTNILQCNECKEKLCNPRHNVLKQHMASHGYGDASVQNKFTVIR